MDRGISMGRRIEKAALCGALPGGKEMEKNNKLQILFKHLESKLNEQTKEAEDLRS